MNPSEYEELVADIIAQLTKREGYRGGKGPRVLRNQVLRGKSGQNHQIDIVVDVEQMGVRYFTLIECKYWNRPIGVDAVMVLANRIEDLGAHKGILVTTIGYQRGAYKLAKMKGIALVVCRGQEEFVVKMRQFPASNISSDNNPAIRNMYEEKYSYYLHSEKNELELTAFPLLLDPE